MAVSQYVIPDNWKQRIQDQNARADYLYKRSWTGTPSEQRGEKTRSGWESAARGVRAFVPAFLAAKQRKQADELQTNVDQSNRQRFNQLSQLDPKSPEYRQFIRENLFNTANTPQMAQYLQNERNRILNQEASEAAATTAYERQKELIDYKDKLDTRQFIREQLWGSTTGAEWMDVPEEESKAAGFPGRWQRNVKTGELRNKVKVEEDKPAKSTEMAKKEAEQAFNDSPRVYVAAQAASASENIRNMQSVDVIKDLVKKAKALPGPMNLGDWYGFILDQFPKGNLSLLTAVDTLSKNIGRQARIDEKAAGLHAAGQVSNFEAQQLAAIFGEIMAGNMTWDHLETELDNIEDRVSSNLISNVVGWTDNVPYIYGYRTGGENRNLIPFLPDALPDKPIEEYTQADYALFDKAMELAQAEAISSNYNKRISPEHEPYFRKALIMGLIDPITDPRLDQEELDYEVANPE